MRKELERWRSWVEELEDHPLDRFEYEAMLAAREGLTDALEAAGDEALWDEVDGLDARFYAITVENNRNPFAPGSPPISFADRIKRGWWWRRVPASPEWRAYLDR